MKYLNSRCSVYLISGLAALAIGCSSEIGNINENLNETSGMKLETGINIDNREKCEAKNGVWQIWGLSQEESCNIRASDVGKICGDSDECEGLCIDSCLGPECIDYIGRCSEFRNYFGCTNLWRDGEREEGGICFD